MSSNLIKLLVTTVVTILLGYLIYPLGDVVKGIIRWQNDAVASAQGKLDAERAARLSEQERNRRQRKEENARRAVVISDSSAGDDWDAGFDDDAVAANDSSGEDDYTGEYEDDGSFVERDSDSFMVGDVDPLLISIAEEEDAPRVEGQTDVTPAAMDSKKRSEYASAAKKLAAALQKDLNQTHRTPYVNDEFAPEAWKKPADIYKTLTERVLGKLGSNASPADVFRFLESPENRLDLARIALIRKVGLEEFEILGAQAKARTVISALCRDLDWMTNFMYSGPTDNLGVGLRNLTSIFTRYSEDLNDDDVRRIASTTATEFAREKWSEKDMMERFAYYYTSFREKKLNKIFNTLKYWETRFVTGNRESISWGSPQSLTWQRDNVRLPVEGYLGASGQLVYRLRNTAGDSVFTQDYLAPVLKHLNNVTALAYREIGGVCGACSHFGAYGALAAGIPAMTMGEPGHCAYTVRVGNEWRKGYTIYWQHSMHKTFWGMHDWEFLILTQELYSDEYNTLVSDQLTAMAEFLAARRMTSSALSCFDAATVAQPLNWPTWVSYAGFLKQKAMKDKARWRELCDHVTQTLGEKYHNAAATLQARYIYPQLLPLVPDLRERNKIFAEFFKKCKSYGIHTWDIAPLLNAQMAGCKTDAEKLNYMKEALSLLMDKADYSGAVLSWGLDKVAKVDEGEDSAASEKFQEEFSKLIMTAMNRMRSGKKDRDATWSGLGEAMFTAAQNGDTRTFQAIGKLAMNKCKKYFPKHRFKFRGFTGKVVSAKGLITTGKTLDGGEVKQTCLHWGVLQKTGGSIPIKFEGTCGLTVKLESASELNGVIAIFDVKPKADRPFHIETSEDGQNWQAVRGAGEVSDQMIRFDLKNAQASGRYVRLLREGDKWDSGNVVGFYVYGKPNKS